MTSYDEIMVSNLFSKHFLFKPLRNSHFDLFFILGILLIALFPILLQDWPLFYNLIVLNLWFFSYEHVVSTYSRIAGSKTAVDENLFLLFILPLILIPACFGLNEIGLWVLPSIYLYWQWFHYMRQSYGIARIYQQKANPNLKKLSWPELGIYYGLPTLGILNRSLQKAPLFLGMPIRYFQINSAVVIFFEVVVSLSILAWLIQLYFEYKRDKFNIYLVGYTISHIFIFSTAYIILKSQDFGWFSVTIWHNLQYILIVWHTNTSLSKNSFFSPLLEAKKWPYYFLFLVLASLLFYGPIHLVLKMQQIESLKIAFVVAMIINIHHYLVDSIIWKKKRSSTNVIENSNHIY